MDSCSYYGIKSRRDVTEYTAKYPSDMSIDPRQKKVDFYGLLRSNTRNLIYTKRE